MTRMKCVLAVVATAFWGTTAAHAADVVLSFDAVGTSDPEYVFTYEGPLKYCPVGEPVANER